MSIRWASGEDAPQHRIVAGILRRGQRILLCRRSDEMVWEPGAWDLPGGSVQQGEGQAAALSRIIEDQLGVEVREAWPARTIDEPGVCTQVFVVASWSGLPRNTAPDEHEEVRWVPLAELDELTLACEDLLDLITAGRSQVGGHLAGGEAAS